MEQDQPILQPAKGQQMRDYTPVPQRLAPHPWPHTPEPHPPPWTQETHPLSGLEFLGLVPPQKPHPAVPTLQEAEAAGNTSYVDVDQQLLCESAGGDSLHNVPLTKARLDRSVGEEWTSPCVADVAMVVVFGLWLGSCLVPVLCANLFISGIEYYTCRKVLGLLGVHLIYGL